MKTLETELAEAGLDVFAAFSTRGWADPYVLNPFARRAGALACVIGNSKALWPVFTATGACGDHPLDRYVVETVSRLSAAASSRLGAHHIHWAHVVRPAAVPIQRVAEHAGLARLGPAWLSVHPEFGPWFGLRAVVVFDTDGPETVSPAPDPCSACDGKPCIPAVQAALDAGPRATWRDWLAARDACPVGRDSRYDEAQLEYHYTKNPACLGR